MPTIWGYCRVSKSHQSLSRQIRNILREYPTAKIIEEVYTRTTLNRKEWNKLMKLVKKGDTIVFDSVSRMSGEAEKGFQAYEDLYNRGINLVFLNEPHINTETYKKTLENNIQLVGNDVDYILKGINQYLLCLAKEQIKIAFAQSQKETDDLHTRIKQGLETAKLQGKTIGCPKGIQKETKKSKTAKEIIIKHSAEFNGNLNDIELIKLTNLSRNTYYKYKKELKNELKGVV